MVGCEVWPSMKLRLFTTKHVGKYMTTMSHIFKSHVLSMSFSDLLDQCLQAVFLTGTCDLTLEIGSPRTDYRKP